MATKLALIDPIKPPDPRRPATLPSLPAWAERLSGAVRLELQIDPETKSFSEMLVLPADLLPTYHQRQAIMFHMDSLCSWLRQTPAADERWETKAATSIAKLTVLAGEKRSELGTDAWSEVYLDVLDDVPHWAVEAAIRLWFKHDCGTDERGKPHDYKWAPDPGMLRKIAQREAFGMSARIGSLQRVLEAREYIDYSEQLAAGRAAMAGLSVTLKTGNLDAALALSFDEAVKLGEKSIPTMRVE